MKLKVPPQKILVEAIREDTAIVVESDDLPVKGKVIAVGRGTEDQSMEVGVDMIVYFYRRDAETVEVDKKYYVIYQDDVLVYYKEQKNAKTNS